MYFKMSSTDQQQFWPDLNNAMEDIILPKKIHFKISTVEQLQFYPDLDYIMEDI